MECPKCGQPTWDNRAKKAAGTFKANAPDFSCKNKDGCGWNSGFGAKTAAPAPQGYTQTAPAPAPTAPPMAPAGTYSAPAPSPRDTLLIELYLDSFDRVLGKLKQDKLVDMFRDDAIAAMVATLYIQRSKG